MPHPVPRSCPENGANAQVSITQRSRWLAVATAQPNIGFALSDLVFSITAYVSHESSTDLSMKSTPVLMIPAVPGIPLLLARTGREMRKYKPHSEVAASGYSVRNPCEGRCILRSERSLGISHAVRAEGTRSRPARLIRS